MHVVAVDEYVFVQVHASIILVDFFICKPTCRMNTASAKVIHYVVINMYVRKHILGACCRRSFQARNADTHNALFRARTVYVVIHDIDIFVFAVANVVVFEIDTVISGIELYGEIDTVQAYF